MGKNLVPQTAKMLGVAVGEKFKVDLNRWSGTYLFGEDGLVGLNLMDYWVPCPELFTLLINGKAKIIKLPWKPKKGDAYYTFDIFRGKWVVIRSMWWTGAPCNYALLDKGWVFRTKEEAEDALTKVAAEMGVEYEI